MLLLLPPPLPPPPLVFVAGCGANRVVTRCRADRVLLRERCGGRGHVPSLAAHARGGPRARVAAVRLVLRADDVRQLRRRGGVGGYDDESREWLQSKQGYNKPC